MKMQKKQRRAGASLLRLKGMHEFVGAVDINSLYPGYRFLTWQEVVIG
jgi:hypothetical protein